MAAVCGVHYNRIFLVLVFWTIHLVKLADGASQGIQKRCPPGRFGPYCYGMCPKQCPRSCGRNGRCTKCIEVGLQPPSCLKSCNKGFFGESCMHKCSSACKDSVCDTRTGSCLECRAPGLALPTCSSLCRKGTFGADCSNRCPLVCATDCDPLTGSCAKCSHGVGSECKINCAGSKDADACKLYCPDKCVSWCNSTDGKCNVCSSGLKPPFCNITCDQGFYGRNCEKKCPVRCNNGMCDPELGLCFGCKPGYVGERCNGQCVPGLYGEKCALSCPETCVGKICHFTNGSCYTCLPGYAGPYCDQHCEGGKFGAHCEVLCPEKCSGACDPVSGWCWRCVAGYRGPFCNETCVEGSYGEQCTNRCSEFCAMEKCHPVTGVCFQCGPKREGKFCSQLTTEPPVNQFKMAVLIFLGLISPVILAPLSMAVYKYKIKKVRDKIRQKRNDMKKTTGGEIPEDKLSSTSPDMHNDDATKSSELSPKGDMEYKDVYFRKGEMQIPKYFPKPRPHVDTSKRFEIPKSSNVLQGAQQRKALPLAAGSDTGEHMISGVPVSSSKNLHTASSSWLTSESPTLSSEHRQEMSCTLQANKTARISVSHISSFSENEATSKVTSVISEAREKCDMDTPSSSCELSSRLLAQYQELSCMSSFSEDANGLVIESKSTVSIGKKEDPASRVNSHSPTSLNDEVMLQGSSKTAQTTSVRVPRTARVTSLSRVPSLRSITASTSAHNSRAQQNKNYRSDTLDSVNSSFEDKSSQETMDVSTLSSDSKGKRGFKASAASGRSSSKKSESPHSSKPTAAKRHQKHVETCSKSKCKEDNAHDLSNTPVVDQPSTAQRSESKSDIVEHQTFKDDLTLQPSRQGDSKHALHQSHHPLHSEPKARDRFEKNLQSTSSKSKTVSQLAMAAKQALPNKDKFSQGTSAVSASQIANTTERKPGIEPNIEPSNQTRKALVSRPVSTPMLRTVRSGEINVLLRSDLYALMSDTSLYRKGGAKREAVNQDNDDVQSDKPISKSAVASSSHTGERQTNVEQSVPGRKSSLNSFKAQSDSSVSDISILASTSAVLWKPPSPVRKYHRTSPPKSIEDLGTTWSPTQSLSPSLSGTRVKRVMSSGTSRHRTFPPVYMDRRERDGTFDPLSRSSHHFSGATSRTQRKTTSGSDQSNDTTLRSSKKRPSPPTAAPSIKKSTGRVLRCPTTRQVSPAKEPRGSSAPKPLPTPPTSWKHRLHPLVQVRDTSSSQCSSSNSENSGL